MFDSFDWDAICRPCQASINAEVSKYHQNDRDVICVCVYGQLDIYIHTHFFGVSELNGLKKYLQISSFCSLIYSFCILQMYFFATVFLTGHMNWMKQVHCVNKSLTYQSLLLILIIFIPRMEEFHFKNIYNIRD